MNISRARDLFRRFPLPIALRVLASKAAHKTFRLGHAMSYAQNGDDRILLDMLKRWSVPYYVDVGCNHPIDISNTFLLYESGWHGLCIDANPYLIDHFSKIRPLDTCVHSCVGTYSGTVRFLLAECSALSHAVDARQVHEDSQRGNEIKVPIRPLSEILEMHRVPRSFGLLSIDVEGMDEEIIRSLDLNLWQPYVIVIEIHDLNLPTCSSHPVVQYLAEYGYQLSSYSGKNGFFVKERQSGRMQ